MKRWKVVPNPMRDDGEFLVQDVPVEPYPNSNAIRLPPEVIPYQLYRGQGEAIAKAHNESIPRCLTCTHWRIDITKPTHCAQLSYDEFTTAPTGTTELFHCTADFGCVMWEAK